VRKGGGNIEELRRRKFSQFEQATDQTLIEQTQLKMQNG
jgi:hypothetical protein